MTAFSPHTSWREQGGGTAASAGVPLPAAQQAVTADQAPLTLLQLPSEVPLLVFGRLDTCSLACVDATCSELFREPMNPVDEALRQRAAALGRVCPDCLPHDLSTGSSAGTTRLGRPWRLASQALSSWRRAVGS